MQNKPKTIDDYMAENRRIRKENKNLLLENLSLKDENENLKKRLADTSGCVKTYKEELFKLQLKMRELTDE